MGKEAYGRRPRSWGHSLQASAGVFFQRRTPERRKGSNSNKLKLGVDLLSLSGGLRSLLTNSSVTKGNVIMENKDYDNFLLDLINVVNDEVNTLMGVEQQVTDD